MSDCFPSADSRTADVVLETSSHHSSGCALLVVAVFWNAITWTIALAMYFGGDGLPWFVFLFIGLFAAIGLWLAFVAIKQLLASMKFELPQVTVSFQPFCLGEEFTGRFHQAAKSHATINRVLIKLICRETATYTAGTSTTTVTEDVFTKELELQDVQRADAVNAIQGEFQFRIPADGMHTFVADNNSVEWLIETDTDVQGWPDYKASFKLTVAPKRVTADRE